MLPKILICGFILLLSWPRQFSSSLYAQSDGEPDSPIQSSEKKPWPATATAICDTNPTIADVENAFAEIRTKGDYLAAWDGGYIPKPWYTTSIKNFFGFRNHFQGIQRVRHTKYVVISGSNTHEPMSNLFVVKMGSRKENGDWASNLGNNGKPPPEDTMIKKLDLDSTMWHAGGVSMLGDILAVPIYGGEPLQGKIIFCDMRNPEQPQRLGVEIDRPGRKAYAATLTRLPNDYFLAAVLAGRDDLPRRLDFYLSKSKNILEGFDHRIMTWLAASVQARPGQDKNFSDFQSINFIRQSDGRLYLIGFHNTALNVRAIPGRDYADLYEVVFPEKTTRAQKPELAEPVIAKVANRQFYCKDGYCNMDAAAGIHFNASGSLAVYAVTFWLDENRIKFTSFRAETDADNTQPGQ